MAKSISYEEKLSDPRWDKKRLFILKRDGYSCKICKDVDSKLHVHHLFYDDAYENPWDYPDDYLTSLCEKCHKRVHENKGDIDMMQDLIKSLMLYFNMPLNKLWALRRSKLAINVANREPNHISQKFVLLEMMIEHEKRRV